MGAEGSKPTEAQAQGAAAVDAAVIAAKAATKAEAKEEKPAAAPAQPTESKETKQAEAPQAAPASPDKKEEKKEEKKDEKSPKKKSDSPAKEQGEGKGKGGKGKSAKTTASGSGPTAAGNGYRLNVKNLAPETSEAELKAMFEPYGTVSLAQVKKDDKGESRGFGFVVLPSEAEGKKAIAEMNDKEVGGKKLVVAVAERRDAGAEGKGKDKGKGKGKGTGNIQQQQQMYMQQMAYMQQYAYMSQYYAVAQQQQALATEYEGSIKSVSTKHGFIVCAQTFSLYERDVYVDKDHLPEGANRGTRVKFTVEMNEKGHPKAKTCKLAAP